MLTDTEIKRIKPLDKQTKLYDAKGLFLLVTPSGGKWWRFRYAFQGKDKAAFPWDLPRNHPESRPQQTG